MSQIDSELIEREREALEALRSVQLDPMIDDGLEEA
jgi:hypothetical protein